MKQLSCTALSGKADVHDDPDHAIRTKRANFATGVAASEFGRSRPHPDFHGFVDRAPGEIAALREAHWVGAAK